MSPAPPLPLSRWLLLLGCAALSLSSCRTAKSVVEAVEVKPSSFLSHAKELQEDRKRSTFIGNWWSKDKKLMAAADRCRKLYIAPMAYDQVRPDPSVVAMLEHNAAWRKRHLPELAQYTHDQFAEVFRKAKTPRYTVVDSPEADALTLELNLLEWGPNTYTGLISRQAVDFFTLNIGGEAMMRNTRGYMAIEGRVVAPRSRQPIFEFADKRYAQVVLIISIQDMRRKGQAHFAIQQWATQLEKMLRTKPGEKVSDSSPILLWNF
jgi:Protein of unknown function (DUF3313)